MDNQIIIILGIFLLFLFLWFLRRYELNKIKQKYHSASNFTKSEIVKVQEFSDLHQSIEAKEIGNGCLTGHFEKRNCFFSTEGGIPDGRGVEDKFDPLAKDILLPKIEGSIFCDHACKVKAYQLQNSNSKSTITFNKNSFKLESVWDYFLKVPENEDELINGKSVIENTTYATHSQSIVRPFGKIISIKDEEFLKQAFRLIEGNYSDYHYSVEKLGEGLNMSVSQVNRRLNSLTGYPAGYYIRSFRLRNAALMLIEKAGSVTDICFTSGFNELGYFSRAFKKQFGCSPTVYKKLMVKKSCYMRT